MNEEQKKLLNQATKQYDNIVDLLTKILVAVRKG